MTSDRLPGISAAVLLVTGALLAIVSLSWPLGWDQGVFAWVGDVVLRGGFPYRDAFDTKGPLTYLPFVAGQAAFGRQTWAIRAFDLLAFALVAIPIAAMLVRLGQRRAVPLALGLFLVWFLASGYWNTAQPDGWAAMLGAAVLCTFVGRPAPPRVRTCIIAGAGIGACVLLKPLYFMLAIVPTGALLLDARVGVRDRIALLAAGVGGTLAVLAATAAVFLAGGALHGLIVEASGASAYAVATAGYDFGASLRAFVDQFALQGRMLLALPAAFAGLVAVWAERRHDALVLVLWLAATLLATAVLGRWEGYDMHELHLVIAVLAGIGITAAWTSSSGPSRALHGIFLALLVIVSIRGVVPAIHNWARWQLGSESDADYARHFEGAWRGYSFRSSAQIADYIALRSDPTDYVLAVENPLVNYLAGRRAPGRFVSARPAWGRMLPFDTTRRREFNASVAESRPEWIVLGPPAEKGDSLSDGIPVSRSTTPAFADELRAHYRLDAHCEDYFLYRREGAGAVAAAVGRGPSCASLSGN